MNVANIQAAYYMVAATALLIAAIYHIMSLRLNFNPPQNPKTKP